MQDPQVSRKIKAKVDPESLLVTLTDAAKMIGVGRSTFIRMKSMNNDFPRPVQIMRGAKPMYRRADIVKYIDQLPTD